MYIIQATQWFELPNTSKAFSDEKPIKYKVTLWSRLNKMPRYIKSNRFSTVVLGSPKNAMYFFYLQVLLITHARDWPYLFLQAMLVQVCQIIIKRKKIKKLFAHLNYCNHVLCT